MLIPLFQPLQPLLPILSPVWAVGGSARAVLLDQPLGGVDVDLTTPCSITQIEDALRAQSIPVDAKGKKWGAIRFTWQGQTYDVLQFRKDTYAAGNRYPGITPTTSLFEDAQRRDFTFNSIYLSQNGEVEDPYSGISDLKAGYVRFIGNPEVKVTEDPLRLLRFLRFCAQYGLAGFTPDMQALCLRHLPHAQALSKSKIMYEIKKMKAAPYTAALLAALVHTPLEAWLKGVMQNNHTPSAEAH